MRAFAERVFIDGCGGFSDDAAYAAMDFLLAALEEVAAEVFSSVAHLLNLDVDVVFEQPGHGDDSPGCPRRLQCPGRVRLHAGEPERPPTAQ